MRVVCSWRCIRSPDSEGRLHVNCWRACPTLRLLVVWHDCNHRSVMKPYRTFTYRLQCFCIYSTVYTFSSSILILISHPRANCHNDPSPFSVCFYRGIYQFMMSAVSVRGNKCDYRSWGSFFLVHSTYLGECHTLLSFEWNFNCDMM